MAASFLQGSVVKLLKDAIKFKSNGQIVYGATDPTAVAVDASIGSLYLNLTSGKLFIKQDAGATTNWYDGAKVLSDFIATKGQVNGIAPLDVNGKLVESFLPSSIVGALKFKGVWNASTNTPTLASGVGFNGDIYIVSVAGATNLDGITDWHIGDWAVFSGTKWEQIDNTDMVISVNGKSGVVTLKHADLALVLGGGQYHLSSDQYDCVKDIDDATLGLLVGEPAGNRARLRQNDVDVFQIESEIAGGAGLTLRGPNASISPDTVFITNSTSHVRLTQDGTVKVSASDYEANIDDDTLTTGKYVDDAVETAIWTVRTLTSADSPFTVTGSKTIYVCDTSAGNIEVVLPTIDSSIASDENRFVKSADANSVKVYVNGVTQTIGSKIEQFIWEKNAAFSVVASDTLEYVITQDSRKVDDFTHSTGVWAKTGRITDYNAGSSTLGTGASVTGDAHSVTITSGSTASTIIFNAVSTLEIIAERNYFAFAGNASVAGIFDVKVQGFNGSIWTDIGTLVESLKAGYGQALIIFDKSTYTAYRAVVSCVGAGTFTLSRGEWTDEAWKSVQLNNGVEEVSYNGFISGVAGAPIQFRTKEKDTSGKLVGVAQSASGTIYTAKTANAVYDINAGIKSTAVSYPCIVVQKKRSGAAKKEYYFDAGTNMPISSREQVRAINVERGDYFYVYSGTGGVTDSSTSTYFSITATPIGTAKGVIGSAEVDLSQYREPTYNVSPNAQAGRTDVYSRITPYKTPDGRHRAIIDCKFYWASAVSSMTLTFAGMTFKSLATGENYQQRPVSTSSSVVTNAYFDGGTSNCRVLSGSVQSHYAIWADVELDSIPSFMTQPTIKPATIIAPVAVVNEKNPVRLTAAAGNLQTLSGSSVTNILLFSSTDNSTYSIESNGARVKRDGLYKIVVGASCYGNDESFYLGYQKNVVATYNNEHKISSNASGEWESAVQEFYAQLSANDLVKGIIKSTNAGGSRTAKANFMSIELVDQPIDTAYIATSKDTIHNHVVRASSTESEAGYCEFTGKTIYKKSFRWTGSSSDTIIVAPAGSIPTGAERRALDMTWTVSDGVTLNGHKVWSFDSGSTVTPTIADDGAVLLFIDGMTSPTVVGISATVCYTKP